MPHSQAARRQSGRISWSIAGDEFFDPDAAMASMLHASDAVDWPVITQAFVTRVAVDYSSLTGQPQAHRGL
jgi:hypothetical protein